jgi:hypothetical protein
MCGGMVSFSQEDYAQLDGGMIEAEFAKLRV